MRRASGPYSFQFEPGWCLGAQASRLLLERAGRPRFQENYARLLPHVDNCMTLDVHMEATRTGQVPPPLGKVATRLLGGQLLQEPGPCVLLTRRAHQRRQAGAAGVELLIEDRIFFRSLEHTGQ